MTKVLAEPICYPFEIVRRCYSVTRGEVGFAGSHLDIPNSGLAFQAITSALISTIPKDILIKNPVGLLTCGSNASPPRLAEKLASVAVPQALVVRIRLPEWVPVYAATLSYYGAIPATFERISGAYAEPFLVVTDSNNLGALVRSEQRSHNYDIYEVVPGSSDICSDFPIFAFVAKYGSLHLNGELVPLKEFQPIELTENLPNQRELIKRVLANIEDAPSLDEYHGKMNDRSFSREMRKRVIQIFGSTPHVPGWKRVRQNERQGF